MADKKEGDSKKEEETPPIDDPHFWLEDVLGEKQLAWAEERNKHCIAQVGDPKETKAFERIKAILE